jgi:hypothetical protein
MIMIVKKNGETTVPRLLQTLGSFFINAFSRIKSLFGFERSTSNGADNSSSVNIETPFTGEQKDVAHESPYMLIMPPGIREKFFRLATAKRETSLPLLNHAGNHSTLALLNINNIYFWGSNNVESALIPRDLNDLKAILKYQKNLSTYSSFLSTPEANAIMKAFKQRMTADRASIFIDRKQCNACGRREFNDTNLRRLLPILRLRELTVFTTNSLGKITKVVLSPLVTNTSQEYFW